MDVASLTVSADRFWGGEDHSAAPCLFVDCAEAGALPQQFTLPPCPLIAIGAPTGELAAAVDATVADSMAAAVMLRNILANPGTAAAVVQLLRLLPMLPPDSGLVAESFAYAMLQGGAEHARWLASRCSEAASDEGAVRVQRTGDCLDIMLDRPGADNAIDRTMRDQLYEALRLAALDSSISSVMLHATGRSFSLGADLDEFGTTRDPVAAHGIRRLTLPAIWALACADKLTAHVQGACVGAGLELVAFARRVTATPRAWFQLPELAMGLLPGAGGCVSLTRRIGRQRTAELILSARRLSARQALDWGLADALVDDLPSDQGGANKV
jgi:enoyl-CoA hydratase/carnithine racemase